MLASLTAPWQIRFNQVICAAPGCNPVERLFLGDYILWNHMPQDVDSSRPVDSSGDGARPDVTIRLYLPLDREKVLITLREQLDCWDRSLFSASDVAEWILESLEENFGGRGLVPVNPHREADE